MTLVDPVPLIAELNERGIPYVIIGGFAVIANGYVRSTEDLDVLVPEGESALSYDEIAASAFEVEVEGHKAPVAGLAHLVALKRLGGRTRDQADLEALEEAHGELPTLGD